MECKGKKTFRQTRNKKSALKEALADKSVEICPVCGNRLYDAPSGMWCVNPDCVVLDDADNYRQTG